MKRTLHFFLIAFGSIAIGCKDHDLGLRLAENTGLSLYWHHTAGLDKGRYLLFSFMSAKAQRNEFKFKFDYRIRGREILITLRESVSRGQCQEYPGPWGNECTSRGDISIPESELSEGQYHFIVQVNDRKVTSTLIVDAEKYTLQIPVNDFFNSSIASVYPAPKNLIFGSIIYTGVENAHLVDALVAELGKLGLSATTIPDHPYQHLGQVKHLKTEMWEPNNYKISLLFHQNSTSVETVFEMVRKYYDLSGRKFGIGLYCSNNMEQLTGGPGGELKVFYRL